MRDYYLFLSKPVRFEIRPTGTVAVGVDGKVVVTAGIDDLRTKLKDLLKHLDKVHEKINES